MDFVCLKHPQNTPFDVKLEYSVGRGSSPGPYSLLFCVWSAVNLNITSYTEDRFKNQAKTTESMGTTHRTPILGNIESFLANDGYYPKVANGHRYSSVHSFDAVQDTENCFMLEKTYADEEYGVVAEIGFDKIDTNARFTMFAIQDGIVYGNKNGYICDIIEKGYDDETNCTESGQIFSRYDTCIYNASSCQYPIRVGNNPCSRMLSENEGCQLLKRLTEEYKQKAAPPGTIDKFIPEFIQNRVSGWDMEKFMVYNKSVYARGTTPDPRNPMDGTRNTGLFPRCSGATCEDGGYKGKISGEWQYLQDQVFRAERNVEIAGKLCGW